MPPSSLCIVPLVHLLPQAVPVKFSLGSNAGLAIFAAGFPKLVTVACTTAPLDPIYELASTSAGGSALTYDAGAGQYVYVWKTPSTSQVGTCASLVLRFTDTTERSAIFKFVK